MFSAFSVPDVCTPWLKYTKLLHMYPAWEFHTQQELEIKNYSVRGAILFVQTWVLLMSGKSCHFIAKEILMIPTCILTPLFYFIYLITAESLFNNQSVPHNYHSYGTNLHQSIENSILNRYNFFFIMFKLFFLSLNQARQYVGFYFF